MSGAVATDLLKKGMTEVARRASALQRLAVEYVPVDSIKPNKYNPNRQSEKDFDLLRRSMREDGFTQPIVVQKETSEIVDGEHRWRAAREEGMTSVPVVFVTMTLEQMRISTLRHNRARGSEDVELGAQVLRDLRELGALDWAQQALQLNDDDLQRLMDDVPAPEALAAEDYSEGWAPTKGQTDREATDGSGRDSMSEEARTLTRQLVTKMEKATTQGEKAQIEQQIRKSVYRINMIFRNEDAHIVRGVLEPKPAQALLGYCRAYLALRKTQAPAA